MFVMKKRILVVEDDPVILDLVVILLEHGSYEVDRAHTAGAKSKAGAAA